MRIEPKVTAESVTEQIDALQKQADNFLFGIHSKLKNLQNQIANLGSLSPDDKANITEKLDTLSNHINKNANTVAKYVSGFFRGITGHGFKSAHTQIIENVGKIKGDLDAENSQSGRQLSSKTNPIENLATDTQTNADETVLERSLTTSEQKTSLQKVKKSMLQKSPTQTTPLLESKIIGKDQRNSKGPFETKINKEAVLNMQIIKRKTAELNKRIKEIDSKLKELEPTLRNSSSTKTETTRVQNEVNALNMEKGEKMATVRDLKEKLESLKKK